MLILVKERLFGCVSPGGGRPTLLKCLGTRGPACGNAQHCQGQDGCTRDVHGETENHCRKRERHLQCLEPSAPYSIDAICVGALWCGDRTLPSVMPTKNIAASITAIAPSLLGGVSLRICLSKSS